jgi:hypothetical protein
VITTQVTSADASGPIAVVGGNLIVAMGLQTGEGSIESIPIDGGSPTTIATGQPNAGYPVACGADICWWTGATPPDLGPDGTSGEGPGDVARLAADGGITMLPNALYMPTSFLFDGTSFFETVYAGGLAARCFESLPPVLPSSRW